MEKEAEGRNNVVDRFPSLVFLGTPQFALPSLENLIRLGARVSMVVSQPDQARGRGLKVSVPPVKAVAERLGIPVFQPERIRSEDAIRFIASQGAECAVVVAYGQLLPQALLDLFPLGVINVHASLLPRYRGAAPIQRCLMAGDTRSGVSIMLLDAGMDTGPVLAMEEVKISPQDTFGTLHDRLANLGADLLCKVLPKWKRRELNPIPQDNNLATYAPPIRKDEHKVQWQWPAKGIVNLIKALDPVPGAYTFYGNRRIKLFGASLVSLKGNGRPGEILGHGDRGLIVAAGDGQALTLESIQLEGQRRLKAAEVLRGHSMPPGTFLG